MAVLVPARNERRALPHLLESLAAQVPPPGQVIVVDDASDDGTGALARSAGATVIESAGPPEGWSGKCWALHQAQQAASGDVLVLLDADVTLAPDGLARMVGELDRLGGVGLVSAEPYHRTQRRYEQLSGVCNVVALMGTGSFTAAGRRSPGSEQPAAMAFGPCMVIDRETYDLVGGHQHPDVRSKITEDLALARRVAAAGRPVAVLAGGSTVAFRMYPEGLRQTVNGWTKVLATGAGSGTPAVVAGVGFWVTGGLLASAAGGRALAGAARLLARRPPQAAGGPLPRSWGADAAVYGVWALQMRWLLRRVGSFGWPTALAFPVPLGFFVACFARSAVKIALGRPLAWRGRALTGR